MRTIHNDADDADGSGPVAKPFTRRAIIVLGMHRSGTSALTRILSFMGCMLPTTLVPANRTNIAGHWESRPICDFDDEVLDAAGTHWLDWLPINPEFSRSAAWPGFVARAQSLLRAEFGQAPLFVVKDPRMCRLSSLWLEALDAEAVEPVIVLVLRHPLEVERSLVSGSYIEDESYGQVLWLRHLIAAEADTRGRRRIIAKFETLIDDWESIFDALTALLGVHWSGRTQLSAREVDNFLDPDLRHHRFTSQSRAAERLHSWVADAYAILSRWADHGETEDDYPTLDALAQAFDVAAPVFTRPLVTAARGRTEPGPPRTALAKLLREREMAEPNMALVKDEIVSSKIDAPCISFDEQSNAGQAEHTEACEVLLLDAANLRHELAAANSHLIQREERLTQMEAQARAEHAEREALQGAVYQAQGEVDRLNGCIVKAEQWVFRLAGDRHAAELTVRRSKALASRTAQLAAYELAQARGDFTRALCSSNARTVATERQRQAELADRHQLVQELAETRAQRDALTREQNNEIVILTGLLRARDDDAAAIEQGRQIALTECQQIAQELAQTRAQRDRLVREQNNEIVILTELVSVCENDVAATEQERQITLTENRRLAQEMAEARAYWDAQTLELDNEIGIHKGLLDVRENDVAAYAATVAWLSGIGVALANLPKWYALVPQTVRKRWEEGRLRRLGLFDADAYRAANPDVAAARISPVRHYLRFGLHEGRVITR